MELGNGALHTAHTCHTPREEEMMGLLFRSHTLAGWR